MNQYRQTVYPYYTLYTLHQIVGVHGLLLYIVNVFGSCHRMNTVHEYQDISNNILFLIICALSDEDIVL